MCRTDAAKAPILQACRCVGMHIYQERMIALSGTDLAALTSIEPPAAVPMRDADGLRMPDLLSQLLPPLDPLPKEGSQPRVGTRGGAAEHCGAKSTWLP